MQPKLALNTKQAYFIGIGGVGMSALARWFAAHGYKVSGSELRRSTTTDELKREGIKIFIGSPLASYPLRSPSRALKKSGDDISRVIYSQAIPPNHPELTRARMLKIPCSSYPEVLGELSKLYKTIAIAGAHGKSTTTSLVALILQKAKFDPTVIVGTKLKEFGGSNFRNGRSNYLVIEADEWRASFLNYWPYAALITNVDREHLDYYKDLGHIKKTFLQFINNVNEYGLIVLNGDNHHLRALARKIKKPVVWYSLKNKEVDAIRRILQVPGSHNLSNALGAYALTRALGIKKTVILKALQEYTGAWRRSEYRGDFCGTPLYDDYGHHPTEIRATLQGFREKFPNARLICVFQPHQRARLKLLFKDFSRAFDMADALILLDVYDVAGREQKRNTISAQDLARAIMARSDKPITAANNNWRKLKKILKTNLTVNANRKNVIIMMGAGDINEISTRLLSTQ